MPSTIPFSILDERLVDLALGFFEHPNAALLEAFTRLEENVRAQADVKALFGVKLFSHVFQGPESIMYWGDDDDGEHVAKAKMFEAVYGAYRNPRAHKVSSKNDGECLREFLLINELFLLERKAVKRPKSVKKPIPQRA